MSGGLFAALALFTIGLAGLMSRRSLLVALMSIELCVLGAVVAFAVFATARGDAKGAAYAIVVLVLGAALALVGTAVAIACFRRRATENLDELRELRG